MYYNKKNTKENTKITMLLASDKIEKAFEMPEPSALWWLNRGFYIIQFKIDGYFATVKGIEFLNDAIARFRQTFGEDAVKPTLEPQTAPDLEKDVVHHLRDFTKNLDSLKSKIANKVPTQVEAIDETFWSMKLWMERQLSQNKIPSEQELEGIGASYAPHKERSTVRAKARSILRWYAKRGFEPTYERRTKEQRKIENRKNYLKITGKSEEEIMTRQEAARVATQTRMARVKVKIEQAVNLLKMQNEKITVRTVAEHAQVARDTAQKYLKELREKGAI